MPCSTLPVCCSFYFLCATCLTFLCHTPSYCAPASFVPSLAFPAFGWRACLATRLPCLYTPTDMPGMPWFLLPGIQHTHYLHLPSAMPTWPITCNPACPTCAFPVARGTPTCHMCPHHYLPASSCHSLASPAFHLYHSACFMPLCLACTSWPSLHATHPSLPWHACCHVGSSHALASVVTCFFAFVVPFCLPPSAHNVCILPSTTYILGLTFIKRLLPLCTLKMLPYLPF